MKLKQWFWVQFKELIGWPVHMFIYLTRQTTNHPKICFLWLKTSLNVLKLDINETRPDHMSNTEQSTAHLIALADLNMESNFYPTSGIKK